MTSSPLDPRRGALILATTSAAGLLLQLIQTRVYGVVLWNHFVYFIVSIALLGYGVSGTWLALGRERWLARTLDIRRAGILFVVTALLSTVVLPQFSAYLPQAGGASRLLSTLGFYSVGVLPYFACGWIMGIVFRDQSEQVHGLYLADLAAAAAGAVVFVALIRTAGVVWLCVGACALVSVPTVILTPGDRRQRITAALVGGSLVLVGLMAGRLEAGIRPGPQKHEEIFMRDVAPGDRAVVEFSEWNTISRQDVVSTASNPRLKGIFTDGDMWTFMLKDFADVRRKETDELSWPYVLGHRPENALVVGSGGGYEVWSVLCSGAAHVDAIEINPTTYQIVRDVYRDWNGGLFLRPEVSFYNEDGRSFVRRTDAKYDLIFMQGVDTFTSSYSGAFLLVESYLYTVEAMGDFLDHLNPDGLLYVGRTNRPPEALRLFANTLEALASRGIEHPEQHVTLHDGGRFVAVVVKLTPFTDADLAKMDGERFWAGESERLYPAEASNYDAYARARAAGEATAFLESLPYDAAPVTDDSPFFFHFDRWSALPASVLAGGLDDVTVGEGPWASLTLLSLLLFAGALVVGFILFPLLVLGRAGRSALPRAAALKWGLYFSCLGVSFIAIEMALMQRLALLLGHPSRSLVLVLGVLLLSAGIGSAVSGKLWERRSPPMLVIAGLTLIAALAYPALVDVALGLPLWGRAIVSAALVAPLGFFMGIPFPMGLRRLGAVSQDSVAWMWGVNGGATVLGSVLAIALAIHAGFTFVFVLAAVGYVVAGLAWRALGPQPEREARADPTPQ